MPLHNFHIVRLPTASLFKRFDKVIRVFDNAFSKKNLKVNDIDKLLHPQN